MDKRRRFELKMYKFKKRLKNHRLAITKYNSYTILRSSSVLCSCWICSKAHKFSRKIKHKNRDV